MLVGRIKNRKKENKVLVINPDNWDESEQIINQFEKAGYKIQIIKKGN